MNQISVQLENFLIRCRKILIRNEINNKIYVGLLLLSNPTYIGSGDEFEDTLTHHPNKKCNFS